MNDILTSNKRPARYFLNFIRTPAPASVAMPPPEPVEKHRRVGRERFKKAEMKNAFSKNVAARKEH